jgi:hypothetical protein
MIAFVWKWFVISDNQIAELMLKSSMLSDNQIVNIYKNVEEKDEE